jgi:predicted heme/steroid binding protein
MLTNNFSIVKKNFFISLLILSTLFLISCSSQPSDSVTPNEVTADNPDNDTSSDNNSSNDPSSEQVFTLEELSAFNGKDGNAAYIAVSGIVYDVTNSSKWKDGSHNGFEAGQDLTDAIINQSPHGIRTLDHMPIVGTLSE